MLAIFFLFFQQFVFAQTDNNFYAQLKAIYNSDFENIKGRLTDSTTDADGAISLHYVTPKTITGFTGEIIAYIQKGELPIYGYSATKKSSNQNTRLFEYLRKELGKIKDDSDYDFRKAADELSNPEFKNRDTKKRTEITFTFSFIAIELKTDNSILIEVVHLF